MKFYNFQEFECALCRSKVSAQIKICRNFIIEDILNTISIPPDEIYIENEIIKNYEVLVRCPHPHEYGNL